MDVLSLKQEKAALEGNIMNLLDQFTQETGEIVKTIKVKPILFHEPEDVEKKRWVYETHVNLDI